LTTQRGRGRTVGTTKRIDGRGDLHLGYGNKRRNMKTHLVTSGGRSWGLAVGVFFEAESLGQLGKEKKAEGGLALIYPTRRRHRPSTLHKERTHMMTLDFEDKGAKGREETSDDAAESVGRRNVTYLLS